MLENGVRLDTQTTSEGYTPLHLAVKRGHLKIAALLLKHDIELEK